MFNILEEYTEQIKAEQHLNLPEIKLSNKLSSTTSAVPVYPMRTKNRGVLFFVNNRHFPHHPGNSIRSGSEHDKFYLISLFKKFGFKIYYYEDVTIGKFYDLVKSLKKFHLNDTESLFFVVTSHGNEYDEIEFYDGREASITDIIYKFNDLACPQMEGKPKIFIFPVCRGKKQDYGILRIQWKAEYVIKPTFSDILICYATTHGFAAVRDVNFGSCYIEAFYRILAERAHELDIENMLYLVTNKVQEIISETWKKYDSGHLEFFQTPLCERRDFNKLLYLNPGYFEEDS